MADVEHPGIRCTAEGGLTAALASDAVLDAALAGYASGGGPGRRMPISGRSATIGRTRKPRINGALLAGRFRCRLLQRVTKADGSEADLCSARDALVLKGLAVVLARVLPVSPRCVVIY